MRAFLRFSLSRRRHRHTHMSVRVYARTNSVICMQRCARSKLEAAARSSHIKACAARSVRSLIAIARARALMLTTMIIILLFILLWGLSFSLCLCLFLPARGGSVRVCPPRWHGGWRSRESRAFFIFCVCWWWCNKIPRISLPSSSERERACVS